MATQTTQRNTAIIDPRQLDMFAPPGQRVGVISCGKTKQTTAAPAAELYTGAYFQLCRRWAEQRFTSWVILSAEHGVLTPDQVVAPYDRTLPGMDRATRDAWGVKVRAQLGDMFGPHAIYTALAGADYRAHLQPLPHVEDVIGHWTQQRRRRMTARRAAMGIGVLKREIKAACDAWTGQPHAAFGEWGIL
jgi:hypothetical protein